MTWPVVDPVGYNMVATSGANYGRKNFSKSHGLDIVNTVLTDVLKPN